MFRSNDFCGLLLLEDLSISQVAVVDTPIQDLFGNLASGKTLVAGRKLHIQISSALSDMEKSVTLYHEVLEALTVVTAHVPESVRNFAEKEFEQEGYRTFNRFGMATPSALHRMLQFYGFKRE